MMKTKCLTKLLRSEKQQVQRKFARNFLKVYHDINQKTDQTGPTARATQLKWPLKPSIVLMKIGVQDSLRKRNGAINTLNSFFFFLKSDLINQQPLSFSQNYVLF